MKKHLLIMFIGCFAGEVLGQSTFQQLLGTNSTAYSFQQSIDGGYIIAGSTTAFGFGNSDAYIVKTDLNGNIIWTKTFGNVNTDIADDVIQAADGNYVFTGNLNTFQIILVKVDVNGDTIWTKSFGGESSHSLRQTSDGGYIVGGGELSYSYLIKTNSNGDTLWTRKFTGGGGDNTLNAIRQTNDNGYAFIGTDNNFNGIKVILTKTDSNGILSWSKVFNGSSAGDYGYSLEQTNDGGYILAGYKSFHVLLIKTDSAGNPIWGKTYSGPFSDEGYSVKQTTDGGYIIAGSTDNNGTGYDAFLIKTNSLGDTIWTRTFGGLVGETAKGVIQTPDGGYAFVGTSNTSMYLVKTDSNGHSVCNESSTIFVVNNLAVTSTNPAIIERSGSTISHPNLQLNTGGTGVTLCSTVAVPTPINTSPTLTISPNPFTTHTTISFSEGSTGSPTAATQTHTIYIRDILGKQIKTQTFSGKQLIIEKGELSNGIYFVQIMDESFDKLRMTNIINKKIIIQ